MQNIDEVQASQYQWEERWGTSRKLYGLGKNFLFVHSYVKFSLNINPSKGKENGELLRMDRVSQFSFL